LKDPETDAIKAQQTRLRIQPDAEDRLTEEIHHFEDGSGKLEQILAFAVDEEAAERPVVLALLVHLLDNLEHVQWQV
jgi:hypothetical protein